MNYDLMLKIALPLVTAIAGAATTGLTDVTGAKAWQDEQAKEIARVHMLKERVIALEAQQVILIELILRKDDE